MVISVSTPESMSIVVLATISSKSVNIGNHFHTKLVAICINLNLRSRTENSLNLRVSKLL